MTIICSHLGIQLSLAYMGDLPFNTSRLVDLAFHISKLGNLDFQISHKYPHPPCIHTFIIHIPPPSKHPRGPHTSPTTHMPAREEDHEGDGDDHVDDYDGKNEDDHEDDHEG